MNIAIKKGKEIITSSLEKELLKLAKDFDSTEVTKKYSKMKYNELRINSMVNSDTKSRIRDTKNCINEINKYGEYKSFIISMKSWTADLFVEDLLFDREDITYDVFMYPFGTPEQLYRVVLNDTDNTSGSITFLDRDLYRNLILEKSKRSKKSTTITSFI